MGRAFQRWAAASSAALGEIARDPQIRRVEIAWTLAVASQRALLVALLVVAFQFAGPLGVAVLGVVQMLPSVLAVPAVSGLGDRYRRERVLIVIYGTEALAVAVMAVVLIAAAPPAIIFVLAAAAATASAMTRPVQMAFLPTLANSPGHLVAANVVSGIGEGIGSMVGPAVGAALLLAGGPGLVAGIASVGLMLAAASVRAVHVPHSVQPITQPVPTSARGLLNGALSGAKALIRLPGPRLIIGAFSAQTLVRGILTVLLVVLAVSTPALGEPGVGVLNAAIGGGILIGSASAIGLAARSRLSPFFILGLVGWGVPIVFIGLLPHPAIAVALLVVLGSANAVLDIAGYTLLQGTVPDTVRAGVLGVLEGLVGAGVAIGGIVGAVLVGQVGLHAALFVTGAVLPVLAVVLWRPLSRLDDQLIVPASQARLLRGVPMFAPLSLAVTERLAGALVPVRFNGSEQIVREGEDGDAFFLIVEGQVEVTQAGRRLRMMGPGESFGEIALLRGVPRTATVRAASEVQVYRLGCADFLSAITGNAYSATAGDRVVDERIQGPPMITPA